MDINYTIFLRWKFYICGQPHDIGSIMRRVNCRTRYQSNQGVLFILMLTKLEKNFVTCVPSRKTEYFRKLDLPHTTQGEGDMLSI